jgi:ubiquinone/menaquinone biosynthesis C-methylase UbiE
MSYESQKKFFEAAYATGSDIWTNAPYKRIVLEYISNLPQHGMILDLGTGRGLWPFTMAELGYKVIGLDYVKHVIEINNKEVKARHLEGKLAFMEGDVFDIPLTDNSIDAVTDFGLMQHIKKDDWSSYAKQVDRILKQGGYVLIVTLSKKTQNFFGFSPLNATDRNFEKYGVHYYFFEAEEMKQIYGNHFEVIKQETRQMTEHNNETLLFTLLRKN